MASPLERPPTDPLIVPRIERARPVPRDPSGDIPTSRTPIGNSARTLLLLGLLAAVGVLIWWWQRPDDMTTRIGAREWVVVEVDGEPAVNDVGTVSTFVLDGFGEVRSVRACNTVTGTWQYDSSSGQLDIDAVDVTEVACPEGSPTTYEVHDGQVSFDGAAVTIAGDAGTLRAVSLADVDVATVDDFAGRWSAGPATIEFGARGLLRVDDCTGSWTEVDGAIIPAFDAAELRRPVCEIAAFWTSGVDLLPRLHDGVLYLSRDLPRFPLDRTIRRLDPVSDSGSAILGNT